MNRLLLTLCLVATLGAQPKRPKIALVFEGGAALGFAHIGVLEWFEANHIPIDQIAGTSMGGLVGGLYAAGYTPAEIQKSQTKPIGPLCSVAKRDSATSRIVVKKTGWLFQTASNSG